MTGFAQELNRSPFEIAISTLLEAGPIVPLGPKSKVPVRGARWKDEGSITNADQAEPFKGKKNNAGLRLDNYLVIDIDGEVGAQSYEKLQETVGGIREVAVQWTGRDEHSRHVFLATPSNVAGGLKVSHPDFPNIDFKSGPGHYVVVAPSIHPNGQRYRWQGSSRDLQSAPAVPTALVKLLTSATTPVAPKTGIASNGCEGARHNLLLERGLELHQQGWSPEAIREGLWMQVATFHDPWSDVEAAREISGVVDWINQLDSGRLFPSSIEAMDIADFLAPHLKGHVVVLENGDWYIESGGVYRFARPAQLKPVLIATMRPAIENFVLWMKSLSDEEAKKRAKAKLAKLKRAGWTDKTLEVLASLDELRISIAELDPPGVLNFQNGAFDLEGNPMPGAICTKQMACEFDPEAKDCPNYERFINWALDPEAAKTVEMALAHALCGYRHSQYFWLIEGDAGNGKSVLMNSATDIAGAYAVAPDVALLFEKKSTSGGANEDRFALFGARLALFSEGFEGQVLNGRQVKSLTSGDQISARPNYGHLVQFKNVAELFLMTNHETLINVDDGGMRRRVKRIRFRNTVDEAERDERLQEKIVAEGSAIINRWLSHIPELKKSGIAISDTIRADTEALFARQNIFAEFMEECLVVAPFAKATGAELYNRYQAWCAMQRITPKARSKFYTNELLPVSWTVT
jgi:P4 family phage/plasmid primase-like protien